MIRRKENNNLGNGPYPIDMDSPAAREAIGFHEGRHVSVLRPRSTLPAQNESHAHAHDSYEFTIPFSNPPRLRQDNQIVRLPVGEMICCNPNVLHGPAGRIVNADFLALQVSRGFLQELSKEAFHKEDLSFSHEPFTPPPDLLRVIYQFIDESSSVRMGRDLILGAMEVKIAILLLRHGPHSHTPPYITRADSRINIGRAVEAMRGHYAEPFSADTLAKIAGMSRYHFFRVFKVHTGKTPYEYLKDIRLEKAEEMLKENSELSITEICLKAGFSTHSHFTSLFYKKTGITPREYRMRHGNQKLLAASGEEPSL